MIDDVKSLPYVKKGDFKGFEKLSYETNKFRNRLLEMGHEADAENAYILQEIESKLKHDDVHKWLESIDDVSIRKVETSAKWLEKQTNIRKIALLASSNRFPYPSNVNTYSTKKIPFGMVTSATNSTTTVMRTL